MKQRSTDSTAGSVRNPDGASARMVSVRDLSCGYEGGSMVVKHLSFTVHAGEKFCILGPNGCGKTTLLRALAGILPTHGAIWLGGRELAGIPVRERARELTLLGQLEAAGFAFTVRETVMLGRYAYHRPGLGMSVSREEEQIVRRSMERCDVLQLQDRLITELSGGQLQRVFLARAFAQTPKVILLDEPTNHLDLRYQVELMRTLDQWVKEDAARRCVIAVLHDIDLALSFADELLLMQSGEALQSVTPRTLDMRMLERVYGMDVKAYKQEVLARWK